MKLILQIAGGIVLAGLVWFVISLMLAGAAVKSFTTTTNQAVADFQQKQEQRIAEQRTRQQVQIAERQRQELERKQLAAAQMRAESDARAAQVRAEAQKEAAWQAFYQPPPECLHPPTWEDQVECGNKHIRAKRDFEARWARGELR